MNRKIQILRAFAIIAVVVIHCMDYDLSAVLGRPFINFAVAMFVFLSGYLTKSEIKDTAAFYKKRILRVLIPYLIWSVVYTVINGTYSDFAFNLLLGQTCFPFYYIIVYIQLVLLTPPIFSLLKSKYRALGWLITPVYLIITRYVFVYISGAVVPYSSVPFFGWFIYYYLGLALGNGLIKIKPKYPKAVVLYGLALVLSAAEGMLWDRFGNRDMALSQLRLSSVLSSVAVCVIAYIYLNREDTHEGTALGRFFATVGDCSFGIYLCHIAVLTLFKCLPAWGGLFFAVKSVAVFAVSLALVWTVRKFAPKTLCKYIGF